MKRHFRGYQGVVLVPLGAFRHVSEEEQFSEAVYEGRNVIVCLPTGYGKSLCYQTLPSVMEHELGGDRAVIIVSALVAILSSSSSVSKGNIGTDECLCRDNLYFYAPEAVTTAKWRDDQEREQFSSRIVAISVDEAHCVSKW